MSPRPFPLPLGEGQGEGSHKSGRSQALLSALLLGVQACAPIPSEAPGPPPTQARRIVNGTDAPDDAAVVALVARRTRCSGDPLTLLCSGVLIAPDVVLTAAHCLDVFGPEGPYEIFLGTQLLPEPGPGGRFVRVARAVRHPAYVHETHAYDAALLRLARPVDTVAPVPLLESPSGALAPGVTARVLGYGDTKNAREPSGRRRQGTLTVTEVTPAAFRAGPAPGMSCVGDSGGPVLVREGEREVLAGLTASGDVACRVEALNVRVDALRDFLQPFLADVPVPAQRVLAPEALCRETCASNAECPAGLTCERLEGEAGRCLLPALQEGAYGKACADDAACGEGGLCARLEPEGDGACRCFTPCDAPTPSTEAEGCTSAPGPALLGLLALARLLRRRA